MNGKQLDSSSTIPCSVILACLVAVCAAIYGGSLRSGLIYDDHELIFALAPPANPIAALHAFAEPYYPGLPYYRPLVRASFYLQKYLHGDAPFGYHLLNVVLGCLFAVVAYTFFSNPYFRFGSVRAAWGAMAATLHPIASSGIYPVSGREALMSAIFGVAALDRHVRGKAAAAALLVLLALCCRESSVMLPVLFAVFDFHERKARPVSMRTYLFLALVGGIYFTARTLALAGHPHEIRLAGSVMMFVFSYFYAVQTVMAPSFELMYEPQPWVWFSAPRLGVVVASLVLAALWWRRSDIERRKLARLAAAWLVLTILPTSNILLQETRFDERHLLSFLMFAILLALTMAPRHAVVRVIGMVLVISWGAASFHRAETFRSDEAFAQSWYRSDPEALGALHLLGLDALNRGEHPKGREFLTRSLAVRDTSFAHNHLGWSLMKTGDFDGALAQFRTAVDTPAEHSDASANLGAALLSRGELAEARVHLENALQANPRHYVALSTLARLSLRDGDRKGAATLLERAVANRPKRADGLAIESLAVVTRSELLYEDDDRLLRELSAG